VSAFSDAAIAAVDDTVLRVYKSDKVPATPTYPYMVLWTSFDGAEAYRSDATHGLGSYRVTTQAVGKSEDSATDLDGLARAALLDKRLAAGGKEYGPGRMQVGAALVRDPDGGAVITVTSTYLFATEE